MSLSVVYKSGQKQGSIKTQNSELVKLLTESQSGNKDSKKRSTQRLLTVPASENINFSGLKQSNGNRAQKVTDKQEKKTHSLANNCKEEILASSEKENQQSRQLQSFTESRNNRQKLVSVNWDSGSSIDTNTSYRKPDFWNKSDYALFLGGDEKEVILSDIVESDRDTLGSSSSELAALKSPSRGSQNTSDESSPKPTLTDDFVERDDTDTPTFSQGSPSAIVLTRSGRGTPHPRSTRPSAQASHGPELLPCRSSHLESKTHTAGDIALDETSPVQTHPSKQLDVTNVKKKTPTPVASFTPRGSAPNSVRNQPPLASDEIHTPSKPDSRFSTPYSSQRLKPQGDAAKRSTQDSLTVHQEDSVELEADSLDFVTDSLEVTATEGVEKENPIINVTSVELVDSLDTLKDEEEVKAAEHKDEHAANSPVDKTEDGIHKISDSINLLSVSEVEKQLAAPDIHIENKVKRQISNKYNETSIEQVERPVFILVSDQRKSRTSSVHTTGRKSNHNLDTLQAPRTASITHHPMKGSSSSNRVYVTSPTFSDEDDMQYRLVSSRLDGEDGEDTYRELDMAAIQSQEAYSGGSSKLPVGKHVTYSDSRDLSVPKPQVNSKNPPTSGAMMNPYGLKMASDIDEPDQRNSKMSSAGPNVMSDHNSQGGSQQGRIISHNPHLSGQALGQSQLSQPNEPEPLQRPSRVRGISLPTGPTYDPRDEEDLQRETSYQEVLRMKIADGNRKAQEAVVPILPLSTSSEDFARDSLDYVSVDDTARAFVEVFKADPDEPPNIAFRNPPPLPQEFVNNRQQPQVNHLANVNFESDDYVDYEDIRHHRVNPQVQPRFYQPQPEPSHRHDPVNSSRYVEVGDNTERSQYSSRLTNGHLANNSQNSSFYYGPEDLAHDNRPLKGQVKHPGTSQYSGRSDFSNSEYVKNKDRRKGGESPMEAVQPKPQKYDFVNNNKEDYGRNQPKSYTHIHEVSKEEKEKLNEIFIQPKVKPKKGILKKKMNAGHKGSQNFDPEQMPEEELEEEEERELSPAEKVWAQRASTLAKRFDGKGNKGKGRGVLQKYNSDSSLNQRGSQQKAFLTEMPTPPSQESSYKNQMSHPFSPRHGDIQVLPVSSQIILDDGQRISVDVNLKLIPSQPNPMPPPNQHYYPQAPALHHQQPSQPSSYYHSSAAYNRQYPTVPQYVDDDFPNQDMPALEYDHSAQMHFDDSLRYVSPRERYSADEALRQLSSSRTDLNPYGKIPPIHRSDDGAHPSSAPEQAGSYTDMFRKQKEKNTEKPWYRVYGLKDYRKMQKEVRLGTLGPDLDSDALKERREKTQRQIDYAKMVMEKNKKDLLNRKPPAFPRPKEDNDIMNRRKLAAEYAKSVPKPIVKPQPTEYNNYELASERSPIAKHHRKPGDMATDTPRQPQKHREPDLLDIEKLRQRYEEDKQNEALIRRNTSNSLPKGEKYY